MRDLKLMIVQFCGQLLCIYTRQLHFIYTRQLLFIYTRQFVTVLTVFDNLCCRADL